MKLQLINVAAVYFLVAKHKRQANALHDSLEDGKEQLVHLTANLSKRLEFRLPTTNHPLWMWLSPCGTKIEWNLLSSVQKFEDFNYRLHSDFEQKNEEFYKKSFVYHLEDESKNQNDITNQYDVIFASGTDDQRIKFYKFAVETTKIILELKSGQNTAVQVFLTKSIDKLNRNYPRLPRNGANLKIAENINTNQSNLSILSNKSLKSITVKWDTSEAEKLFVVPVKYCLVMSENLIMSFCEIAMADRWKSTKNNNNNNNAVPDVTIMDCVNSSQNEMQIVAFGEKSESGNGQQIKRYSLALFAINSLTGSSAHYGSIMVDLPYSLAKWRKLKKNATNKENNAKKIHSPNSKMERMETRNIISSKLYNSKLQAGHLGGYRHSTIVYQFYISKRKPGQNVLLIVHACHGYVKVAIYRRTKLLYRSGSFTGFHRFLVVNAKFGRLTIKVLNDDSKETLFKIWASTRPETNPYPNLPIDTSIKETDRTCTSANLEWLRSSGKIEYCLYKRLERPASGDFLYHLIVREPNYCQNNSPSPSHLIGCFNNNNNNNNNNDNADIRKYHSKKVSRYFYKKDEQKTNNIYLDSVEKTDSEITIRTRVDNLKKGSTYRFDVFVRPLRRRGQVLPYRTLWVRTRNECLY